MLLVDDINIIFTNFNLKDFQNILKIEFESWQKWFKANGLLLNFNKIIPYISE